MVPDKENNVLIFFNSLWNRLTSKFQSRQSRDHGERYDIGTDFPNYVNYQKESCEVINDIILSSFIFALSFS